MTIANPCAMATPIPGFTLRPATADDAGLILAFIEELAVYEKLAHEVVATEPMLRENLFGDSAGAEAVIAEFESRPVGYTLFFPNFSTFLGRAGIYIEDIYIQPAFRGRGFGRTILARLAALVKERGGGRLEWSVLDWNVPAIEFYRSIGAVALEGWLPQRLSGTALDRLADEFGGPGRGGS